jgi:hypothetical protein
MARKKTQDETTITKAEAVRRALADGKESPPVGVAYIKEQFGIDIAPQHFSTQKSQLKNRAGVKVKGKRGPKPAVAGGPEGEAGLLEALEAIKPLVAAMGAEKVKRLVDLLG